MFLLTFIKFLSHCRKFSTQRCITQQFYVVHVYIYFLTEYQAIYCEMGYLFWWFVEMVSDQRWNRMENSKQDDTTIKTVLPCNTMACQTKPKLRPKWQNTKMTESNEEVEQNEQAKHIHMCVCVYLCSMNCERDDYNLWTNIAPKCQVLKSLCQVWWLMNIFASINTNTLLSRISVGVKVK